MLLKSSRSSLHFPYENFLGSRMYRIYLTSFLSLTVLMSPAAQAKVGVEYRVSRMHGLFDFALAVAGYPHQAESMVRVFDSSREKTPSVVAAVAALDHLHSSLEAGVEFVSPVASRTRGESIHQILLGQSFFAKDLADFQIRATGLLTPNDQTVLFDSLAKLEPVFDRLVWKNSEKALNDHRRKLEALAGKAKLDEMFEKAVAFYGAKWPSGLPFTVGLYPTPFVKEKGYRNSTHSSSQGTIEEHGVMMVKNEEDLAGSFGTIFHELCHSLYASQTDQEMIEFEKAFETNRSAHSILAYNYINEALATALGNGWAAEKAAGRVDGGHWYTNPYIDGFAKAIFPIVKENVEHAKKMDAAFVSKVIDAFAQKFPEAPYEFEALFNRVVVVTESMTSSDLRRAFRNRFAISSYSGGALRFQTRLLKKTLKPSKPRW